MQHEDILMSIQPGWLRLLIALYIKLARCRIRTVVISLLIESVIGFCNLNPEYHSTRILTDTFSLPWYAEVSHHRI